MTDIEVLTPSYGYGRFIEDALDSVSLQQGVAVDHIVQDGDSDDGTVELLTRREDPRLRWSSEPDEGQSDALNKALRVGSAPWLAWLNADEFYFPDALSRLLSAANSQGADVVYGDAAFVDQDGSLMRLYPQHRFSDYVLRHYGTFIPSCTLLLRRSFLERAGWRSQYRMIMDWDLYLRLRRAGAKFAYVPALIAGFRIHPSQVTATPASEFSAEYAAIRSENNILHNRVTYEAGRSLHVLLKALNGGYKKQRRASVFRGESVRWFGDARDRETVDRLRTAVYGRRR